MTTVSDRVIATESAPAAELTDGYHVVVETLKLNGVETIYGCGRYPGHLRGPGGAGVGYPLHRHPSRERRPARGRCGRPLSPLLRLSAA